MNLKQRRDKVLLFRVTEQEHEILADLCAAKGGRSLSEYLREELLNQAPGPDLKPLRGLIRSLDQRLSYLEDRHSELTRRLRPLIATLPAEGSPA
jgi:hypothetical protein